MYLSRAYRKEKQRADWTNVMTYTLIIHKPGLSDCKSQQWRFSSWWVSAGHKSTLYL